MSDYPMLISNKLHSFRNFYMQMYKNLLYLYLFILPFCFFEINITRYQ